MRYYGRRATVLVLLIGVAAASAIWITQLSFRKNSQPSQTPIETRPAVLLHDNEGNQQTDIAPLLEDLSNKNDDIRESSRKRIVALGKQSGENRQIIIADLLKRVEAPEFKERLKSRPGSFFWVEVSKILYELNAVEAIDFLIDCLDCLAVTEPVTNSFRHKPAVDVLIGLGQPAVPKLAEALSRPDPRIRFYAAICLGSIQGDFARQALSEALRNETDSDVQTQIRLSIAAIDRRE